MGFLFLSGRLNKHDFPFNGMVVFVLEFSAVSNSPSTILEDQVFMEQSKKGRNFPDSWLGEIEQTARSLGLYKISRKKENI